MCSVLSFNFSEILLGKIESVFDADDFTQIGSVITIFEVTRGEKVTGFGEWGEAHCFRNTLSIGLEAGVLRVNFVNCGFASRFFW